MQQVECLAKTLVSLKNRLRDFTGMGTEDEFHPH